MATMESSGGVEGGSVVRESVRQGHVDGHRCRESPGRLTVHRALLAPQGCRPAVPQDGPCRAVSASRRGRLRTAGSRRDAGSIQSRPHVIEPAPRPHWHAGLNPLTGRSRREMTHGTLETRPPLLDTDGRERRLDSTAAVPTRLDARNDQLAGGRCPPEGIDSGCLAGQPADTQSFDQVVRCRRRLSQGQEGDRQHAASDRVRPRTAGGRRAMPAMFACRRSPRV